MTREMSDTGPERYKNEAGFVKLEKRTLTHKPRIILVLENGKMNKKG